MALPCGTPVVDAHEDLAYHCHEYNRDLVDPQGVPCMVTLPGLQAAGVRLICATLFTAPGEETTIRRYKLNSQYEQYRSWLALYSRELKLVCTRADLQQLAGAEPVSVNGRVGFPIGLILLMEGCDLLSGAVEAQTWFERGVRMAGLTWNGQNRFASGCFGDGRGIKHEGWALLDEFRRLGMILDLAHLNERGIAEALERFDGPLCSSHSNARRVCNHERNLTDPHAVAIAGRGGVIGLNLLASLVQAGWKSGAAQPVLRMATDHVVHLARLVGDEHVGLGTDLDGGLTPDNTPQGIDRIEQIGRLAEDLDGRGWDSGAVERFMGGNWWRFFERCLPA